MTPEEQRIAIAEVCPGWSVHHGGKYCAIKNCPHGPLNGILFDPLNDLNATAEMERHLGDINNLSRYADELDKVCVPTHICSLTHWQATVMATASQRAEAFLKCLNLWKD